jgi:hypothetical protein
LLYIFTIHRKVFCLPEDNKLFLNIIVFAYEPLSITLSDGEVGQF